MSEYDTDEERLEALKRWWRENGMTLLVTVGLAISGVLGWQYWGDRRQEQAEAAALLYERYLTATGQSTQTANVERSAEHFAQSLREDHPDTVYAAFVALDTARRAVADRDAGLDAARRQLQWVLDQEQPAWLADLARLRLARIALSDSNYEDAIAHLDAMTAAGGTSAAAELRGDVYAGAGNPQQARVAYERARAVAEGPRPLLEMKLDTITAPATAGAEDEPAAEVRDDA